MAYNVTKAKEKTMTRVIDYGDQGDIHLTFYPDRYTPEHEDAVDEVRNQLDNNNAATFTAMMLPLIADWDIMYTKKVWKKDTDGNFTTEYDLVEELLPIEADSIKTLPYHVLRDMMDSINKALLPGEMKTTNSEGSFA